jgi:hypothetical protein
MEAKQQALVAGVAAVVIVAALLVWQVGGPLFRMFLIYSYAKKVPISIGYDEAQEYWILSSVVNEQERFRMVLEDNSEETLNDDQKAITESEVGILLIPQNPYSRTILAERGMKEDEITVSDVTSISKSLKGIFETNLGFAIRIGKKRRRVIIIPADWAKVDSTKHRNLFDFEAGDSHKDVHQDTYVHQSEKKNPVERFFPDHGKCGKTGEISHD